MDLVTIVISTGFGYFSDAFPSPLVMPGLSDLNRLAIIITGNNYRSELLDQWNYTY